MSYLEKAKMVSIPKAEPGYEGEWQVAPVVIPRLDGGGDIWMVGKRLDRPGWWWWFVGVREKQ